MRAPLIVLVVLLAGCFGGGDDARGALVPYARMGDVAVYDVSGGRGECGRGGVGIPLAAATAQVRFTISSSPDVIDAARAVHPVFKLTTEVAEAGVFGKRGDRYVSPLHAAVVQSHFPLSQDQSVVAFDERGFPWLFGASVLHGEELTAGARFPFEIPDNLGRSRAFLPSWVVEDEADGVVRLSLVDAPGMTGTLWMERGSAWPVRAEMTLAVPELAPHVRSDGGYPATMSARRVSLEPGAEPLPPRNRGAIFGLDASVTRAEHDGEKPPDGDATLLAYPLSEAVRDAKLLDRALAEWLAARDAPILYRATYQVEPGPVDDTIAPLWLLQFVDRDDAYYEVQISRLHSPLLPAGLPRVESSGPAEAPASEAHGWFPTDAVPAAIVPLSEGIRVVRDVFGATDVQIFLRSFTDPPGYSYFLDGGFEEGGPGRYTVVYNPNTGLLEQATGPVSPRLAG